MKGSTNAFLPGLALANVTFLASLVPDSYLQSSIEIECKHLHFIVQHWTPTVNALKSTSDFILILMLLDRCRVMKFIIDLRIQKLRKNDTKDDNTSWIVQIQVLLAFVLSVVLHLPLFFYDRTDYLGCNDIRDFVNETTTPSPSQIHDDDLWTVYGAITIIMVKIVPILVIVGSIMVLIKRLREMSKRRQTIQTDGVMVNQTIEGIHENRKAWTVNNKTSMNEQNLAHVMVYIAISYVVFTTPANIEFVVYNLPFDWVDRSENIHKPIVIITNFFETLHYALKFYIYFWMHQDIRKSCIGFFKTCFNRLNSKKREEYEVQASGSTLS